MDVRRNVALCAVILLGIDTWGASPSAAPPAKATHWQAVGWGGGGYFWSCACDPRDPNVLYLGGDVAGIYKSVDQGRHWRFINRGLNNYAVYSLAVAPSDPHTLYALTDGGVCRSVNGGEDWEFLPATAPKQLKIVSRRHKSVRGLAVADDDPQLVYAGSGQGGLFKTTDGGKNWQKLPYQQDAASATPSQAASTPAYRGRGFLVLQFESDAAEPNRHGRAEKPFPQPGINWSAYRKLTARFCVPPGAPRLEGQLVIQSGPKWLWQQGPSVVGTPGQWTDVRLDLAGLKDLDTVHYVYFVVRAPQQAYHGEVFLDAVALHATDQTTVDPGTAPPAAGVTLLGDWEQPGDVQGWHANQSIADGRLVVDVHQSAQTTLGDRGGVASVVTAGPQGKLVFVCNPEVGLFRSTDAGAHWIRLKTPAGATSLAIAPRDPRRLYASFGGNGLYRSSDQGDTWTAAGPALPPKCEIGEVALDPQHPDTLCCIANGSWKGTFYRSDDAGGHWTSATRFTRDLAGNPTLPDETGGVLPRGVGGMSSLSNLAIHPRQPQLVFIAGNWNNLLSADGGRTWNERIAGADITCTQDIQFCDGTTYAVAMDEGLLASDDHGQSWRQLWPRKYIEGTSGHQWRVRAWKQDGATRIVSTVSPWPGRTKFPNAVLASDDGGRHFRQSSAGLPSLVPHKQTLWGQGYAKALAADPQHPDTLYLAIDGEGGGLFRSHDAGRSWEPLPGQPAGRAGFFALDVDPTEPRRLFFGACGNHGGLYRSEDAGASWQRVFAGEYWVFNAMVGPSGAVYCGGKDLHVSRDHGRTWKTLTHFPEPEPVIVGIAVDPRDEKRIWISRVIWGDYAQGGVYATADAGHTWQEITGDLPHRKPLVLRYDPSRNELWAGGVGLFKTAVEP